MHVAELKLTGYRCLVANPIQLNPYTCFIGRNDTGKSCVLRALRLLLDARTSPSPEDLTRFEPVPPEAYVEAKLVDVPEAWPCGRDGILEIRRRVAGGTSTWDIKGPVPSSPSLRKMAVGNLTKGELEDDASLTDEVRAALTGLPVGKLTQQQWVEQYANLQAKGLVDMVEDWGPVAPGTIGSLFQTVFLAADSKAEEETAGSKSTFNDLGGMLVRAAASSNDQLSQKRAELEDMLTNLLARDDDGHWTYEPLNRMEAVLREEVHRFDPSVELVPLLTTPTLGPLSFGMSLDVRDEHIQGLSNMGHGLQRSVTFAMLRAIARMPDIVGAEGGEEPAIKPFRMFLIEEPELYLHPQAERVRMHELQELSSQSQTQVVLCSHSAFFVDIQGYQNILRFSRPGRGAIAIHAWSGQKLTEGEKEWLKIVRFFDAGGSAMLFADCAVLCEGATEKACIPAIADRLGIANPAFEAVDCSGSGNLATYQKVLEALKVPYVVWMDGDGNDPVKKTAADKRAAELQAMMTAGVGALIINKVDWEDLAGIMDRTQADKPFRSRKKFLIDKEAIPADLQSALKAAYSRQSLDMR